MKKYALIILTGMFLSCATTNPKLSGVIKLKNGTTVEGLMTDPSHYVGSAPKSLAIKTSNGKFKYKNNEIEKVTILGQEKIYVPFFAKKFMSLKPSGKIKYLWLTPVSIPNGKASLYSGEKEQTNQKGRYIGTTTFYYVWKKGEEASNYFTSSELGLTIGEGNAYRTMIENVFQDCPELIKKSKDERYKPKNKSVIDVVNEYNSTCGK
ncbi:hypothetical protein [Flavobacterium sp. UBA7680]|uniref:hypothetical protein n=1 Tax=Flavobacterium sp. UBA7680 TaxID=1946559 RepID=UPI0025C4952C|nr:hypothetical protein [Flavobacterium sp. UBA7680]